jgi:hypothetical protein
MYPVLEQTGPKRQKKGTRTGQKEAEQDFVYF